MPARILVVDDIQINVKLLEAKLAAEYFDVVTARNGREALEICAAGRCDIVLLDVMMPEIDGFEVCRRLKSNSATAHLPVVMVTALDQPRDRNAGLEAGADDFLTKPVDDVALLSRVRSLVRLKAVTDELRARVEASRSFGIADPLSAATKADGENGRVLLVDDRESSYERLRHALAPFQSVDVEPDPQQALIVAAEGDYDAVVVSLDIQGYDALRLCSQLRTLERTRNVAVLAIAGLDDRPRILRALDIGVHDFLMRPVDRNELIARVRTQIRRKRYAERLRASVQVSLEMAVTDGLTGLHNRRYLDLCLATMFEDAARRKAELAVLLLDIDRFKSINDTHGHEGGDEVLREFARRIKAMTRAIDVVARFGGEEMVVVLPDAELDGARRIAERIRERIGTTPFSIHRRSTLLNVTVSIGVAAMQAGDASPADLLKRADLALYRAKDGGRNRVEYAAA